MNILSVKEATREKVMDVISQRCPKCNSECNFYGKLSFTSEAGMIPTMAVCKNCDWSTKQSNSIKESSKVFE